MRKLILALAAVAALGAALPAISSSADAQTIVVRHGDRNVHHRGWDRGRHYGWDRGRHYGWDRGRHRGWDHDRGHRRTVVIRHRGRD